MDVFTFEGRQRLQLDILRVPVPRAALRLLRLLLERSLGERIDAVDERRRHGPRTLLSTRHKVSHDD